MRNIAFSTLFVLFSYYCKRQLHKAIFTQKHIYNFFPWAHQLMVHEENIKILHYFLEI